MLGLSPSRYLLLSFVQILNLPSNVCDHLGHCWWCHMSSQASRAEPRPRGDVWTQLTGWDWMRGESWDWIPRVILRGFMSRTWAMSWDRAGTPIYQREARSPSYSTAATQLRVPPGQDAWPWRLQLPAETGLVRDHPPRLCARAGGQGPLARPQLSALGPILLAPPAPSTPGAVPGAQAPPSPSFWAEPLRSALGHSPCLQDLLPQMVPLVSRLQPPSQPFLLPLLRLPRSGLCSPQPRRRPPRAPAPPVCFPFSCAPGAAALTTMWPRHLLSHPLPAAWPLLRQPPVLCRGARLRHLHLKRDPPARHPQLLSEVSAP